VSGRELATRAQLREHGGGELAAAAEEIELVVRPEGERVRVADQEKSSAQPAQLGANALERDRFVQLYRACKREHDRLSSVDLEAESK
jgi:hypothetical protein